MSSAVPIRRLLTIVLLTCFQAIAAPRSTEPPVLFPRSPLAAATPAAGPDCALQQYVKFNDNAFDWSHQSETKVDGATIHHLRLTSQRWRADTEVDQPLWKHWVTVSIPDNPRHKVPILVIGGGRHRENPPATPPGETLTLARAAGAVVIYVDNVPNQPLKLAGDDTGRTEDDLVARSWLLAMRDDDASWIVRFPMVKSVVRTMDAVDAFLEERTNEKPEGYFVVGASKRGWTTWLTAAIDKRVLGIAPMVIDVLNLAAHTPHHWRSYGFWAPSLRDYEAHGLSKRFGSDDLDRVMAHEDPLAYLPRVAGIPKYIVNATGDEFFPTDSLRHYEDKIPGVWRARCVPNTSHSLANSVVPIEILAFYRASMSGASLPELSWTSEPGETGDKLVLRTSEKPLTVTLWEATNENARDFRFNKDNPSAWTPTILAPADDTGLIHTATIARPPTGWRAYLAECRFAGPNNAAYRLVFTTRVFITPDTLPFELPKAPE